MLLAGQRAGIDLSGPHSIHNISRLNLMQSFTAGGLRFAHFRTSSSGLIHTFNCLDEEGFKLELYEGRKWVPQQGEQLMSEGASKSRYK